MSGAQRDEAPPLGAAAGLPGDVESWRADTGEFASEPAKCKAKRLATVQAALALRGYEATPTADGIVIRRWGLARLVPDVDALEAFAVQAGCRT